MTSTVINREIAAPPRIVFETVADIEQFSQAVPRIQRVEFLTEARSGVGTRFRETRLLRGREATTELEVTEYVPGERVRLVADSHGTVWDTVFEVTPAGTAALLTMRMEARPYKLVGRAITALSRSLVEKAVTEDMDAVQRYCEKKAASTPPPAAGQASG